MPEPKVGDTRTKSYKTARQNADGTSSFSGDTKREEIFVGKKAAAELGVDLHGRRGAWVSYRKSSADAANRSARINKNNPVRDGRIGYDPMNAKSSYGGVMKTSAARYKQNNPILRMGRKLRR